MKTVFIILLCILVFFGCLAIGIFSGYFSFPSTQPASVTSSPSTQTIASNTILENNKQQNLVLILIDNLGTPGYHLESVWLLLFTPDYPDLTLLMLYPSPKEPYKNLANQFKLTPDGKLDTSFTDALHSFKFNYQGFILIDEEGLSQWIDWMNGIDIDGNTQNGANVQNYTPKPWNDFDKSIKPQMTVATGLCKKTILLPKDVNWFTLLGIIFPDHMSSDLSLKDTVVMWKNFLAKQEKAKCKILTP
jgi:hypothetical protein